MSEALLNGSHLSSQSKLDELRQEVHENKFQNLDEIRQFVNRYVTAYPDKATGKSISLVGELVGNIRSELGLASNAQPGITNIITDHVRDLVLGRAQASEDTARWAVHHAANQVKMYSGQFVYDAEDIFIDGAGLDFLFRRTYKSQGFYNGPLGVNWDHNYNLWLRILDGGKKIVRLIGGFQESAYVKHDRYHEPDFNYWVPPPGEHTVIFDMQAHAADFGIQNAHNCDYGLRLPDGTVYFYERDLVNPDPNLLYIKRIEDRLGNYLEFHYKLAGSGSSSRLESVDINNPARYVTLEYDALDRIIAIKDYKPIKLDDQEVIGRTWRYIYDDYGDLVAFTTPGTDRYPQGLTERYIYSTPYYTGELQHNLTNVYDTAGRLYLENEFGTDTGLLSFNRIVRQREGNGERYFEYEDVSLATGLPTGQPEIEEDIPAFQTVMVRRNGHPVHYVYNKFGNLIAREEDAWASGVRRWLVTHYRYNRDGALIGMISPEGRETLYLYDRDEFIRVHEAQGLIASSDIRQHKDLEWKTRLSFGNRLSIVRRKQPQHFLAFQFPNPLSELDNINPKDDIIVKFNYESTYQNLESVSHPQHTKSPYTGLLEDIEYNRTLTTFVHYPSNGSLKTIKYPNIKQADGSELKNIEEHFLGYDGKGRLTKHEDPTGTLTELAYFPFSTDPSKAPKEGYLQSQTIDPNGVNLQTEYQVNAVGVATNTKLPKGTTIEFGVNDLNQVQKVTRTLKLGVDYETRFTYCRNMRVERIERDVQDAEGKPLWSGTEVQFFHYDENDNISSEQIGSPDFGNHLVTRHTYDDGDLRVATTLPRGNRIRINYDERRLPEKIRRGVGSPEATDVEVSYDGDGLLVEQKEQKDDHGLKTEFTYDAFERVIETRDYDEQENLYRLIRHDYDKAGNLTTERLFIPDGSSTYKLLYHAYHLYNELN
ncbi:MAG TPA: hypothetical protein DIU00_03755 [Phycisphaerales bacterium]|nr:hypothetical protein [Phycisphaerales bacterium]